MMDHPVVAAMRHAIVAHRLFTSKARVVVAVSGGVDSVVLLHALSALPHPWRLALHIAHLDHALRSRSAEDAAFVCRLARQWRVPVTSERRDVRARCAQEGWSLEDGARRVRYQFLLDVARRHSADAIALAHTADDQAETVLMRLVRGTGLTGLGAIPVKRLLDDPANGGIGVWVVRPLLEVWRRDIAAYAAARQLSYREDETNRDTRFVRNRIRHRLLPLLEREYNPNVKTALTQLAEQSRWDHAYLQDATRRQWKRLVKVPRHAVAPGAVAIAVNPFLRLPPALQRHVVRRAIQHVRGDVWQFEFRHWLQAQRMFQERSAGAVVDLPGGFQLRREADYVICQRAPHE